MVRWRGRTEVDVAQKDGTIADGVKRENGGICCGEGRIVACVVKKEKKENWLHLLCKRHNRGMCCREKTKWLHLLRRRNNRCRCDGEEEGRICCIEEKMVAGVARKRKVVAFVE
jgi:hypothetical protein